MDNAHHPIEPPAAADQSAVPQPSSSASPISPNPEFGATASLEAKVGAPNALPSQSQPLEGEPLSNKDDVPESPGPAAPASSVVDAVVHAESLESNDESPSTAAAQEIGGAPMLQAMLAKIESLQGEVEAMMASMPKAERVRQQSELNQLQAKFASCAAFLPQEPSPSSTSDSSMEQQPTSTSTPTKESPQTYLDTVPEGPVEGIVRFFSSRPRSAEWGKHIAPRDAEPLLLLDGPLGDAVRRRVTDIELNAGNFSSSSRLGEVLLSLRDSPERLVAVLQRCGANVKKLAYVGDRDENSPPHMTSWMDTYRTHCTNVRHLTLHRVHATYFEQILAARSGKVESLTLDVNTSSRSHLYLVARHCCGLRKLNMCPGLSIPESLWEHLGPTLSELEMSPVSKPPGPKVILKYIQEHCRALTRFSLSKESAPPELVDLLKSYGEQLTFAKANFGFLPFPTVQSLAAACPNAVFELSGPVKLDIVMGLQYRVHALKFSKPMVDPVPPNFFTECTHIRSLSLQLPDADAAWLLTSFLREPKPHLAEVTVTGTQENPAEILDTLAAKTSGLTKLKLCSARLPVDALAPVLAANPALTKLVLKARTPELRTIRQVLQVCAAAPALRELRIGKLSTPSPPPRPPVVESSSSTTAYEISRTADACMPFRRRNTFVQISSVDYVF